MKSFAIIAAFAGAASAQASLGPCAQLCVNNMATIAQTELQCGQGDTTCFCTRSNWAYGIRDCSRQACGEAESAAAVAWAAGQCAGGAASASSVPAAIPILSSALATASGSAASAAASVTGSLASAVTTLPLVGSVTLSDGSVVPTTTGFSTVFGSLTGSAASEASGIIASGSSAASGALASASSAAGSALSSASGALNSLASSASGALNSATSRAASAANSATGAPSQGAAAVQTGLPVLAGAGSFAMFFL